MSTDQWQTGTFIHHRVKNLIRRGWLLKTYYDEKILKARVKTNEVIENDKLDVLHPVGYIGRVKPAEKVEIFTMDVGGDPSRRVVMSIIGDREEHPKVDEGESALYSPGDKKKFVRVRKGPEQSGGGQQAGKDYGQGKDGAIEIEGEQVPVTTNTKKSITSTAKESITSKAGGDVHIESGSTEVSAGIEDAFLLAYAPEALAGSQEGNMTLKVKSTLSQLAQKAIQLVSQNTIGITAKGPIGITSATAITMTSPMGVSMGSGSGSGGGGGGGGSGGGGGGPGGGGITIDEQNNSVVHGDLVVEGDLTVEGDLIVKGTVNITGSFHTDGAATFQQDVTARGKMYAVAFVPTP